MAAAEPDGSNVKQAVPFFGVSNMEASLHFYIDGLGFQMFESYTDVAEDTVLEE